jgi:hypothetical protein
MYLFRTVARILSSLCRLKRDLPNIVSGAISLIMAGVNLIQNWLTVQNNLKHCNYLLLEYTTGARLGLADKVTLLGGVFELTGVTLPLGCEANGVD